MPHAPLTAYPGLQLGFSSAADGTMAIDGGWERRLAYLEGHGLDRQHAVHAGLTHGNRIAVVTAADGGKVIPATDGLITAEMDIGLVMTAADCLLVTLFDPTRRVIGLAHAGSRGLASGVLTEFVRVWRGTFPTDPADLIGHIGPSICARHYPVDPSFAAAFDAWPMALRPEGKVVHLDLRVIAVAQLTRAGLAPTNIDVDRHCTYEDRRWFSYRRDHPTRPQLQVGYAMMTVAKAA